MMKRLVIKCSVVVLGMLLLVPAMSYGQGRATGSVSGVVLDASSPNAADGVPYAVVSIPSIGVNTVADADGKYSITGLAADVYEMTVSSLGYTTNTVKIKVSGQTKQDFVLVVADFYLDQVVVSATASKTGAATASNINRTAIEHMQANSLADVMALLPGADITSGQFKPDLQGIKTQTIRGGQAMGTAIVMDGAPISNGANMQTMTGAIGNASTGTGGMSPSSGIDLRNITTDNIESVEVIRGVASVEYGNATSGTVIVNSKAGKEPLTVRFNTNPNIYSIGLTHGVGLGPKKGFLNYGVDYAYSVADPREGYDYYQRSTARLSYSNTFLGKLNTTTTASFNWSKDKATPNPDDEQDYQTRKARDYGFRVGTNGTFNANKGWFKNIKYNVTFNYTDRLSYKQDKGTNADWPYSFSKVDGSVLSSIPGQKIYDTEGNELTKFGPELAGEKSWITPAEYMYEYNVYGKELNTYAKVLANFAGKLGSTNHHLMVGADFVSDGNVGKGKVFDHEFPPYRNLSYDFATQRDRAFKDIPFLNHFGAFAEEDFRVDILNRELQIVAGVRYDYISGVKKGAFAPRFNASYELIPDVLSIRGAYGVNVKTPTLAFVYPDKAYFDMLNFDNSRSWYAAEPQIFQLITTRIFDASNPDLELAKVAKSEVGLDLKLGQVNLSVTAYRDQCVNGYSFGKRIADWKYVQYDSYDVEEYPDDEVTLPALTKDNEGEDKCFLSFTTPGNNTAYRRDGIEFVLDFGRIDAIRTSFLINGEYFIDKSWSNGYSYYNKSGDIFSSYSVYDARTTGGTAWYSDFITNFVITHNIPKIGFVVSLTASVNWNEKSWVKYPERDDIPVGYLDIADGLYHDFDPANAEPTSPDYKTWLPILRNEDNGALSPLRREIEPAYKPALCINANVTKQFNNFSVSFFANNVFRSTPLQPLKTSPGSFVRRNGDVFFFGLQLTAKIF